MNIYLITNKVNNKKYVGLTTKDITKRFKGHVYLSNTNNGYYLHNAMRKYSTSNFTIKLLDTASSLEELKQKEIYNILKLDTYNNGYNLTKGGDFCANNNMVVVRTADGNKQISITEFLNGNFDHVNKGLITIFKNSKSKRVTTHEYKHLKNNGWYSKNKGYTTVILSDNTKTKIKSQDFDPNIHKGIQHGKQTYYNSNLKKFVSLTKELVDLSIHFNINLFSIFI